MSLSPISDEVKKLIILDHHNYHSTIDSNYTTQNTLAFFQPEYRHLTINLVNEYISGEEALRKGVVPELALQTLLDYFVKLHIINPDLNINDLLEISAQFQKIFQPTFLSSTEEELLSLITSKSQLFHGYDRGDSASLDEEITRMKHSFKDYSPNDIYYFNELNINLDSKIFTVSLSGNLAASNFLEPLIITNVPIKNFNYYPTGLMNSTQLQTYLTRINLHMRKQNRTILLVLHNNVVIDDSYFTNIDILYVGLNFDKYFQTNSEEVLKFPDEYGLNYWVKTNIISRLNKLSTFDNADLLINSILYSYEICMGKLLHNPTYYSFHQLNLLSSAFMGGNIAPILDTERVQLVGDNYIIVNEEYDYITEAQAHDFNKLINYNYAIKDIYFILTSLSQFEKVEFGKQYNLDVNEILSFLINKVHPFLLSQECSFLGQFNVFLNEFINEYSDLETMKDYKTTENPNKFELSEKLHLSPLQEALRIDKTIRSNLDIHLRNNSNFIPNLFPYSNSIDTSHNGMESNDINYPNALQVLEAGRESERSNFQTPSVHSRALSRRHSLTRSITRCLSLPNAKRLDISTPQQKRKISVSSIPTIKKSKIIEILKKDKLNFVNSLNGQVFSDDSDDSEDSFTSKIKPLKGNSFNETDQSTSDLQQTANSTFTPSKGMNGRLKQILSTCETLQPRSVLNDVFQEDEVAIQIDKARDEDVSESGSEESQSESNSEFESSSSDPDSEQGEVEEDEEEEEEEEDEEEEEEEDEEEENGDIADTSDKMIIEPMDVPVGIIGEDELSDRHTTQYEEEVDAANQSEEDEDNDSDDEDNGEGEAQYEEEEQEQAQEVEEEEDEEHEEEEEEDEEEEEEEEEAEVEHDVNGEDKVDAISDIEEEVEEERKEYREEVNDQIDDGINQEPEDKMEDIEENFPIAVPILKDVVNTEDNNTLKRYSSDLKENEHESRSEDSSSSDSGSDSDSDSNSGSDSDSDADSSDEDKKRSSHLAKGAHGFPISQTFSTTQPAMKHVQNPSRGVAVASGPISKRLGALADLIPPATTIESKSSGQEQHDRSRFKGKLDFSSSEDESSHSDLDSSADEEDAVKKQSPTEPLIASSPQKSQDITNSGKKLLKPDTLAPNISVLASSQHQIDNASKKISLAKATPSKISPLSGRKTSKDQDNRNNTVAESSPDSKIKKRQVRKEPIIDFDTKITNASDQASSDELSDPISQSDEGTDSEKFTKKSKTFVKQTMNKGISMSQPIPEISSSQQSISPTKRSPNSLKFSFERNSQTVSKPTGISMSTSTKGSDLASLKATALSTTPASTRLYNSQPSILSKKLMELEASSQKAELQKVQSQGLSSPFKKGNTQVSRPSDSSSSEDDDSSSDESIGF
ncbi:uncharacterized protein RJT20DRAFT_130136 [Scheffersomyces xylosifermentans]|uniref:uncharacterized protein n=1 Tax=Scheffersomyces xylosifermentans TaxID=1304137 RepID=UPI00315D8BB6